MAFLRMELRPEDIVALHARRERHAVCRFGESIGRVVAGDVVRMNEIEPRLRWHSFVKRTLFENAHGIPAHVRDLGAGIQAGEIETHRARVKPAQSRQYSFFAGGGD